MTIVYYYFYGPGTQPNRRLEFHESEIICFAFKSNEWRQISKISLNEVHVESMSVSDKIHELQCAQKESRNPVYKSDTLLSDHPLKKRLEILSQLEPNGSMRVEITVDIKPQAEFEFVVSLSIFDPV